MRVNSRIQRLERATREIEWSEALAAGLVPGVRPVWEDCRDQGIPSNLIVQTFLDDCATIDSLIAAGVVTFEDVDSMTPGEFAYLLETHTRPLEVA